MASKPMWTSWCGTTSCRTARGMLPPALRSGFWENVMKKFEEYSPAQLKRAQVLTGELLWLSGRSRPDIMHSVATMSSLCVKNPELVERIGLRVLGYLKNTAAVCLWYKARIGQVRCAWLLGRVVCSTRFPKRWLLSGLLHELSCELAMWQTEPCSSVGCRSRVTGGCQLCPVDVGAFQLC